MEIDETAARAFVASVYSTKVVAVVANIFIMRELFANDWSERPVCV